MIVPLHVKSHHSWCAGTSSPQQLVARAAHHKAAALALTDVDNLHGQPEFQRLCLAAGVAPIIGAELRRSESSTRAAGSRVGRIVLLARDAEGYANLCRIVSVRRGGAGCSRAREAARDPVQALAGGTRGLFVMTDDPRTLERLLASDAVDRVDLRLLLVRPSTADEGPLLDAAARSNVPLVADPEIVLLDADDRRLLALLVAALGNRRIAEINGSELEPAELWFRSPAEQLALFADRPRAVEETMKIAAECRFRLTRTRPIVPGPDCFGGDPALALEQRCRRALADAQTLARIDRADTLGCYQIETPLLRSLLVRMPIRSLDDCAAALALVRPGAGAGAGKRAYLEFLAGERARPPLYDEDLLELLSAGAGISLAAADRLRTGIIESEDLHDRTALADDYVRVAIQNHRDPGRARVAWQQAVQFAAYSFCKAHAWSHALLAYQSAYLKTHHLVEFGCALLDSYGGAYPLRTIAADLQRSGAVIDVPSVNRSALATRPSTTDPHTIVLGLGRVKHLRNSSAAAIIAGRERRGAYTSIDDLTSRVPMRPRELQALISCGACDELARLPAGAGPAGPGDWMRLVRVRNELEVLEILVTDYPGPIWPRAPSTTIVAIATSCSRRLLPFTSGIFGMDHLHMINDPNMLAMNNGKAPPGLDQRRRGPSARKVGSLAVRTLLLPRSDSPDLH